MNDRSRVMFRGGSVTPPPGQPSWPGQAPAPAVSSSFVFPGASALPAGSGLLSQPGSGPLYQPGSGPLFQPGSGPLLQAAAAPVPPPLHHHHKQVTIVPMVQQRSEASEIEAEAPLPPTATGSRRVSILTPDGAVHDATVVQSRRHSTVMIASRTLVLQGFQDSARDYHDDELDEITLEAQSIFRRIVGATETDTMSRLQFVKALRDKTVASFCLPGIDPKHLNDDDDTYEAAHHFFFDLSKGRPRVRFQDFLAHFKHSKATASHAVELRKVFERIDANKDNRISRHELIKCVKRDSKVADFLLRKFGIDHEDEEEVASAVDDVYKAICGDSKWFDFADFIAYFRSVARVEGCGLHTPINRSEKRVLIIGPGFGAQLNPMQKQVVERSGFQIFWCHGVPNPEDPDFNMLPHASKIHQAISECQPDLLCVASKGGVYGTALWQMGYWRGPTVMINAHPTVKELPLDVPIVICHGDQDPIYRRPRAELEQLITTGSPNMCFLYYSSTSGRLTSGHTPRVGDQHNMASLVTFECLPRLMESVLCPEGPELHMMRTWIERMTPERQEAERHLGFSHQKIKQYWVSTKTHTTATTQQTNYLYDVAANSPEARLVATAFRASARDPSTYGTVARDRWARMRIVRIQRVENGAQQDAGIKAYHDSVKTACESMGVEFVPGVHTRWLFHGSSALDSIVSNPLQGFQPLASGSQGQAVWGLGTYFARDAEYVAAGPFCGAPAPDGTRRMLLCLVTTGMSCAGDPNHFGILPFRRNPIRYNSSVDSLASPEIYIVQHPGAAYPAYVITFIC